MLLMIEKGITGGITPIIYQYTKANNKYIENYDKNKEFLWFKYLDVRNLCGWAMSQKLPVNAFKWAEDISELDEDFIRCYINIKDIFLKLMFNILEIRINFTMIFLFCLKTCN